jgi:hypothetical protein
LIRYGNTSAAQPLPDGLDLDQLLAAIRPHLSIESTERLDRWVGLSRAGIVDWTRFGQAFAP